MTVTAAAAATQAGVTTATIRTWARRGVIAAVKTAGRWAIDAASLARRIAIGAMRTRKQATVTDTTPLYLTSNTRSVRGHIGVVGSLDILKAAFEAGETVTLTGKFDGERVYLGHTRQTYGDYGITMETIGLDAELGESPKFPVIIGAVYLIDLTRLDNAPRLATLVHEAEEKQFAAAAEAEQRAADEENRYLNPDYV